MTVNHMLVYGTLRRGQHANSMMERHATYVDTVALPDAVIFSLGGFPGVRLGFPGTVECDLYHIHDPVLLDAADRYEGSYGPGNPHNLYNRVVVQMPDDTPAYIYEYNGDVVERSIINSGSWLTR